MCSPPPLSPSAELAAVAAAFFASPDPDEVDLVFMFRRIQAFGSPKQDVRWPTFRETSVDASDGEIRAIAFQYGVSAAALLAMAMRDGVRTRAHVEENAFRLRAQIEAPPSAPHGEF